MSDIHQHPESTVAPRSMSAGSQRSQLRSKQLGSAGSNARSQITTPGSAGSMKSQAADRTRPPSSVSRRSSAAIEESNHESKRESVDSNADTPQGIDSATPEINPHLPLPPIQNQDSNQIDIQRSESSASNKAVSFSKKEMSARAIHKDGQSISISCQTEWSWITDMQTRPPQTADGITSQINTSTPRPGSVAPSGSQQAKHRKGVEDELQDLDRVTVSSKVNRNVLKTPGAMSMRSLSSAHGLDTATLYTEVSESGVPLPYEDDTYGIPVLDMTDSSDDGESSDEEAAAERKKKKVPTATLR